MAAERNAANAANAAAVRSVAPDVPTGLRVYDEGGRVPVAASPEPRRPSGPATNPLGKRNGQMFISSGNR